MSAIKGPGAVGGPSPVDGVAAAEEPGAVEVVPAAEAVDPAAALFEGVAAELAAGAISDPTAAIRAAVERVLEQELAALEPATRAALVEQTVGAMEARPDLLARLEALLGKAP